MRVTDKCSYPLFAFTKDYKTGCKINYINLDGIYCFDTLEQAKVAVATIVSYINNIQKNEDTIALTYVLSEDRNL